MEPVFKIHRSLTKSYAQERTSFPREILSHIEPFMHTMIYNHSHPSIDFLLCLC